MKDKFQVLLVGLVWFSNSVIFLRLSQLIPNVHLSGCEEHVQEREPASPHRNL